MSKVDSSKLTIPIYLNTKIVFDMLATIEDGFSQVKNIQTTNNESSAEDVGASIGASNIFAFLNVGITANKKKDQSDGTVVNEERTHTPVSLFQKLKWILEENELIKTEDNDLFEGDFVEVQGVLKENPLIDLLVNMKELIQLINAFSDDAGNSKGAANKNKLMQQNKIVSQMDALIHGLQADGKKDIICVTSAHEVVLPTDVNYFLNKNMGELTEGNYKILGKVTKICVDQDETISLLRNTAFSKLKLDRMQEFQNLFKDESLGKFVDAGEIKTEIAGPTFMIIPIAIYI